MDSPPLHAVIMAGGRGTRFWPASRRSRPKQFLSVTDKDSLLTQTRARLNGLVDSDHIWVVTGEDQVGLVQECLPELPRENILAEPVGRNTAACCAWAALEIAKRDPDSIQIVLPADHVVEPVSRFRESCALAVRAAQEPGVLVTLGIQPTYPATGYGYIESLAAVDQGEFKSLRAVTRFVEKPDKEHAQQFLEAGSFLWNAGIFVWSTESILAAFREHAPEILLPIEAQGAHKAYAGLPSVPVDVAILEQAERVVVLPVDYRWNDVGSWSALSEVIPADKAGMVAAGAAKLVQVDSKNCITYGEAGETIALLGVEDLIVVRSGNATLICPRDRAQDVRLIVEQLERDQPDLL